MSRKFISFVFLFLGLCDIAPTAYGQGIITQCNGCTTGRYDTLASSLGVGHHLIGDFTNNVILGYHVTREPSGRGGYLYTAEPEEVSPTTQDGFLEYRKLIVDYHASSVVVVVPTSRPAGYPTAVDSVSAVAWARTPNYTNFMNAWFTNLQTQSVATDWLPGAASVAFLAMQSGVTVSGYATSITFQIQTTDGALVTLKWTDDAKTILESVIDQYGNHVPIMKFDRPTNFGGNYVFSDKNPGYSQSLVNYLNNLGAHISVNPSQFPSWYICVGVKCDALTN